MAARKKHHLLVLMTRKTEKLGSVILIDFAFNYFWKHARYH